VDRDDGGCGLVRDGKLRCSAAGNVALRHQIGVLQRSAKKRLSLSQADRLFWIGLSPMWAEWRSALKIVKPDTVIARHRNAFRKFWIWKVRRGRPGRPTVSFHGERLKPGIDIGETMILGG
jgi:hypothetical protein